MGCLSQHISILRLISKLRVKYYSPRKSKLGGVIKLMLGEGEVAAGSSAAAITSISRYEGDLGVR